jgi:hypothetical protein
MGQVDSQTQRFISQLRDCFFCHPDGRWDKFLIALDGSGLWNSAQKSGAASAFSWKSLWGSSLASGVSDARVFLHRKLIAARGATHMR